MAYKKEKNINVLQLVIIFILGVLVATNIFFFIDKSYSKNELISLNSKIEGLEGEIGKLKTDDVALAQAINDLLTKLEARGILTNK